MLFRKKKKPATSGDPAAAFWQWFVANEKRLLTLAAEEWPAKSGVLEQLKRVHADLTYEVATSGTPRELVISADGFRGAIASVESLVDCAPALPRWTIVRFRRRHPFPRGGVLEMNGVSIPVDDVWCTLHKQGSVLGVILYMPGWTEEDDLLHQAFILLDLAIGEYDVMCRVGEVASAPVRDAPPDKRVPYHDLAAVFDESFERFCTSG